MRYQESTIAPLPADTAQLAWAILPNEHPYLAIGDRLEPLLAGIDLNELYPPDKRRRDLDNFDGKALWDALTKAGVWKDDSQVKSRYSEWGDVLKGGNVFVTIYKK